VNRLDPKTATLRMTASLNQTTPHELDDDETESARNHGTDSNARDLAVKRVVESAVEVDGDGQRMMMSRVRSPHPLIAMGQILNFLTMDRVHHLLDKVQTETRSHRVIEWIAITQRTVLIPR